MQRQQVSLIGYRGTGKSTAAQLVARQIGWEPVDADEQLERMAGQSIKQIFDRGGEPAFRDWEARVVAELSQRDRTVVSWGGGVILRESNRRAIRQGMVIWLTADPETIQQRLQADSLTTQRRPNLTTAGGLDEIQQLLRVREPLYRECADQIVDTVAKSADQVADEIVCFLRNRLQFAADDVS